MCIKPYGVKLAAKLLAGSPVVASTTIGFPHGGHLTPVKVFEAERAMDDGAMELDMVVNVGKVLSGEWNYVAHDISAVVLAAHARGAKVKVIFENAFLKDEHKRELCRICGEVRADWVKTSTGYAETGATIEDPGRSCGDNRPGGVGAGEAAAGGVRTFEETDGSPRNRRDPSRRHRNESHSRRRESEIGRVSDRQIDGCRSTWMVKHLRCSRVGRTPDPRPGAIPRF